MWLDQYNQKEEEPQREVHELNSDYSKLLQESMHGNFGGRLRDESKEKGKVMLTGAILGIMAAVYFGKSPLYFGLGGAVIGRLITREK
tara:strand:+ start:201 stop:464 length:264 start_codon:yes stop_codon:yes gene_type:complete